MASLCDAGHAGPRAFHAGSTGPTDPSRVPCGSILHCAGPTVWVFSRASEGLEGLEGLQGLEGLEELRALK